MSCMTPPRTASFLKIAAACLILSTSGCNMYRLEELRHTTASGTPFQNELSKLYMDFAADSEKGYDWANSWHFADKGLMAAYGKDVEPEDLKNWDIPQDALPGMEKARADLMVTLTPEIKQQQPGEAANAQFYFDCWVKFQEANWQEDNIAYCRDNLTKSLDHLHGVYVAPVVLEEPAASAHHKKGASKKHPQKQAAAAPKEAVAPDEASTAEMLDKMQPLPEAKAPAVAAATTSYIVFFEKGQPVPSDAGNKVLEEVAHSVKNTKDYDVIVSDHSNGGAADPVLSKQREDVVKKLLINAGVHADAIRAKSAGGAKAAHRVEIFLNE